MRRLLLGSIFATLVGPAPASAQFGPRTFPMVDVGSRVQIGISNESELSPYPGVDHRMLARIVRIAPDTLYLETSDTTVALPRIRIASVEESLGVSRKDSAWDMGSTAAVLLGLILPVVNNGERRSDLHAAFLGASAGLAVGALTGALFPYERWGLAWIPE